MTMSTHPRAIQEYRNDTKARVAHSGVMSPTFKCRCCKDFKRTVGRVKHPVSGYVCKDCHAND